MDGGNKETSKTLKMAMEQPARVEYKHRTTSKDVPNRRTYSGEYEAVVNRCGACNEESFSNTSVNRRRITACDKLNT